MGIEEVDEIFKKKLEELERVLPKKYSEGGKALYYNCAALTMKYFLEIINVDDVNLINMAATTASVAKVCGAVNAGLMITGYINGKKGGKLVHQMKAAAESMKFIKRFKKEFNSVNCPDLTGCDLLTVKGMQEYLDQGIWSKQCYKHVIFALDIIRKLYKKKIGKLIE
ncbi:MAG: C-GCAxxG-C-C family protein [Candidatus Helarchaeota archaeon]